MKQVKRSGKVDLIQEETATRGQTAITSTTGLVSSTEAKTEFEKAFRQAVEESGLNWTDNSSTQLPATPAIQEDSERRQMARIRTLIRAEQIRARRLKKIKSKSYRKLLRKKEMKGMHELITKLDKEDPEAAEQIKAELEKKLYSLRLNRQRQARLKWSRAAQRFGGREIRSEVSKQAQAETDEKRELIRAIKGKAVSDDDDSDSSFSGSDDEDDIVAQIKKTINSKVVSMAGIEESTSSGEKGLLGMKFMRDAASKQRNETIAEAEEYLEALESSSDRSDQQAQVDNEIQISIESGTQEHLVASLFATPVQAPAIITKQAAGIKLETPQKDTDPVPGWGDWVGEGVKPKKKRRSSQTPPVSTTRSTTCAIIHMANDETLRAPLMKYQVEGIPYPYKSRAEYEAANANPIGPEWMSLSAHSQVIEPKVCARLGAVVPPIKLAKHLDADKRAKLIDAWDHRKKPRHTKARFL